MVWHLLTGDYPPSLGGVSHHTRILARALSAGGAPVEVWAPRVGPPLVRDPGLVIHELRDNFGPSALRQLDRTLRRAPEPVRLLVQYVPHAYGFKGMNLGLCAWLYARRRWDIRVIFHEVAFPIRAGQPLRHRLLGVAQRLMAALVARAARQIVVTIPPWAKCLARLAPAAPPSTCVPVFSNIAPVMDGVRVQALRARFGGGPIVGHFGTMLNLSAPLSEALALLLKHGQYRALMLGRDSIAARTQTLSRYPGLAARIFAGGAMEDEALSLHLQACDLLLQPYADGATGRRGSLSAALAHGIATVTNESPLSEAWWRESRAVAIVPAAAGPALAETAQRVLTDPVWRRQLSAAARALYLQRFDLRHTLAALGVAR